MIGNNIYISNKNVLQRDYNSHNQAAKWAMMGCYSKNTENDQREQNLLQNTK